MAYIEGIGIFQYVMLWITIFFLYSVFSFMKKRKLNLPPGPRGLPIVGILPFLGNNPHLKLIEWSKKYGDIFSIYLGRTYVVVITDAATAKLVLGKTSSADRPPGLFSIMPDGAGFAQENGPVWHEQRRYTMMEMKNLGLGKSNWEKIVHMEVADMLEVMEQSQGKPLDIRSMLSASISNNVVALLTNHRLPMGHPNRDVIDTGVESFQLINNQSGIIQHYPTLSKLLVKLGLLNIHDKVKNMKNMNKYIKKEIEELKEKNEGNSFIEKYLTEIEKNKRLNLGNSFDERSLIGNVQALIIAGSDTTYISIYWLLLAMATFPEKQKKVHEELDSVLGKDGLAAWADRNKLPYCLATIMEGQRWRTVAPLNLLHRTNEDIVINGYDIPKGTDLINPIWAFHYDSKYWKDPDMFQPERFLSDDGKTIKEREAYLPFSFGKRMCPGKTVAYIEVFDYFVCIMQKFQVLPESETKLPDLEGFAGLTLQPKKQPLRFISR